MADERQYSVTLVRRDGAIETGVWIYRAAELPDEGEIIGVERPVRLAGRARCRVLVTSVQSDAETPISAEELGA
jgi:hypothetical protein